MKAEMKRKKPQLQWGSEKWISLNFEWWKVSQLASGFQTMDKDAYE